MKIKSLKNRIILLLVSVIIVLGTIVSVWVGFYTRGVFVEKKKDEVFESTKNMADRAEKEIKEGVNFATEVSLDEKIISFFNTEDELKNKEEVTNEETEVVDEMEIKRRELEYETEVLNDIKKNTVFKDILIMDLNGSVIATNNPIYVEKNFSYRNYFKKALDEGSATEIVISTDNLIKVIFANSIKNKDGLVLGNVVITMLMDEFEKKVVGEMASKEMMDHRHILTDENGVVFFSSKETDVMKSIGEIDPEKLADINKDFRYANHQITSMQYDVVLNEITKKTESGILEVYDEEEGGEVEREYIGFHIIKDTPYYLVMEYRAEGYLSEVAGLYYVLSISILTGVLLAAAGCSYFIGRALLPLRQLKNAAEKIGSGNFEYNLLIESGDEIEEMSLAFIGMSQALKESKSEIDEKVEIQTREIVKKNSELENQKRAILNILEDVKSEKEKSELLSQDLNKFRLAVENASDHVAITDKDGIVLYGNKAMHKITGYSLSEIKGKKAGTKINWGGNMPKDFYANLWDTIKNKKEMFSGIFENKRKDGSLYYADTKISPILNSEKNVEFFVVIARDITKEIEVDKAKTEFVSLASHQLRTPLTSLKWNLEMIKDVIPNSKDKNIKDIKEMLKSMDETNEGMIDLVNGLLNVSRIDLGTFAVDPKMISPRKICEMVIRELAVDIKRKKIKLSEKYDDNVGDIMADPKLLKIVVQNIVSNAVKYTPQKGNIEFEMKKDGKYVLFSVKDSGIGIPRNQQAKIFGKLFRADNAIQSVSAEGTGLGLYVARAVVEQSEGKIWFESRENKGTTFHFTIPLSGMKKKEGNKELNITK